METLGTVNFEDLFDFSPEPLGENSNSNSATVNNSTAGTAQKQQQQAEQLLQVEEGTSPQQPYRQTDPESVYKLSQSVPSNWGSNFPASLTQLIASPSSNDQSAASSFNTSVGTLLDELPEQSLSTGQKGKRGRKPGQRNLKTDMKSKLERSRQSARECRARKKLRYQYLDDLILEREKANNLLREELAQYHKWCLEMDSSGGVIPEGLKKLLQDLENEKRGL